MKLSARLKKLRKRIVKQQGKIDRGAIFVVVFLLLLIFTGFLFVGGTLPTKLPDMTNKNFVALDPNRVYPTGNALQLHTFAGATLTPFPTLQPFKPVDEIPLGEAVCPAPNPATQADLIWAYRVAKTPASDNEWSIQIFYSGAFALPAGKDPKQDAMKKQPVDHIRNIGIDRANTDADKIPISPVGYVTDITLNAGDTSGDAAQGGVSQSPSHIYGAWRTEKGIQAPAGNGFDLGAGADQFPGANNFGSGGFSSDWTAQIIWKASDMKTKNNQPLLPGHIYRVQIFVHGDVDASKKAMVCFIFTMP